MRQAILAMASAATLAACATTTQTAATPPPSLAQAEDFTALSCRQLVAEIELTQKAYAQAVGAPRPALVGEPMASLYAPIAYTTPRVAQAPRLKARLDELQRASRAKRCASSGPKTATA